jgi:hypothetical protein
MWYISRSPQRRDNVVYFRSPQRRDNVVYVQIMKRDK